MTQEIMNKYGFKSSELSTEQKVNVLNHEIRSLNAELEQAREEIKNLEWQLRRLRD